MRQTLSCLFIAVLLISCGGEPTDGTVEEVIEYPAATKDVPEVISNRLKGPVKSMTTIDGSDSTISFYNKEGYIDSIIQHKDTTIQTMIFKRDANGWIDKVTYLTNGVFENELVYEYREERRQINIVYALETVTSNIEYDQAGRKIYSLQQNRHGMSSEIRLQYDDEGRVVSRKIVTTDGNNVEDIAYHIEYNDKDFIVKQAEIITNFGLEVTETSIFSEFQTDAYENWIYRKRTIDQIHEKEEFRRFTYYQ